jgi:hypothetical protein
MTDATKDFRDVLEADARRRAMFGGQAAAKPADPAEHTGSWDVRFRLVNTFPRETRPLFASLRAALAPYGYTLSPLHPAHDLSRPRMQAELARVAPEDPARFAPLVFELDPGTTNVRVFVRQYGGRAAPDFAERTIDIAGPPDLAALEAILKDYVTCMLEAAPSALAA